MFLHSYYFLFWGYEPGLLFDELSQQSRRYYTIDYQICFYSLIFQFLVKHTDSCNILKFLDQKIRKMNYQKSSEIYSVGIPAG